MEKKNLIISVSGEVSSGKSRLTLLLKKFLRENGFDVEFDGGVDYENETQFDEYVSKNLDQVIEHIKDTRTITLKEVQVKRDLV
jgi:uridine kinase